MVSKCVKLQQLRGVNSLRSQGVNLGHYSANDLPLVLVVNLLKQQNNDAIKLQHDRLLYFHENGITLPRTAAGEFHSLT